jgi:GNAT superfamily N-acetyltransferase
MASTVIDIQSKDIPAAANVLTAAFRGDPLFAYIFGNLEHYNRAAPWMFATWVRWVMLYGKAWATPNIEAVALRKVPGNYHVSPWSIIRSGMLPTPIKLGMETYRRFDRVVTLLEKKHDELMGMSPHWYCECIAVVPGQQGKGLGKLLMEHTFQMAYADGLPCYLETASEKALSIHLKHGYEVRETVQVPDSELKICLMVRPHRQ